MESRSSCRTFLNPSYAENLIQLYPQVHHKRVRFTVHFSIQSNKLITVGRFGFNTAISQLLTVPPYFVASKYHVIRTLAAYLILLSIVALILLGFALWSDRIKMRSPFILAGLVMCLIGFAINISKASVGAKYLGTFFCVSGSYAAFPGVVSW